NAMNYASHHRRAPAPQLTGSKRFLSLATPIIIRRWNMGGKNRRDLMFTKYLATALLGATLISAPALAQNSSTTSNAKMNTAAMAESGQWRSSKLDRKSTR